MHPGGFQVLLCLSPLYLFGVFPHMRQLSQPNTYKLHMNCEKQKMISKKKKKEEEEEEEEKQYQKKKEKHYEKKKKKMMMITTDMMILEGKG